ncbi:MAG: hypothetical protein ACFE85_02850 [Candidatus Hodarchaeota archaeon]
MAQLELVIPEIMIVALGIVALIPNIKKWKDSKNRMYMAVIVYTVAVISHAFFETIAGLLDVNTNIKFISSLRIGYVIGYVLFIIQFEFMLYLRALVKLYSLPFIITFYLIVGNIIIDNSMPFIIYAMILSYGPAYILLRDGKRNRNGLAIGMGLFFLIWGSGQMMPNLFVVGIFKVVATCTLVLGSKGFYEKYIFLNQEEEQKIMGTWIAKFVVKE